MTRVLATAADAGRSCPYCRFPLKEGVAAECCDACNSLHHEDCWRDGGGCAVLGCPRAATDASAPAVGAQPTPPPGHPGGGYAPPPALPRRSGSPLLAAAVVIALLGIGTGVVVATSGSSGRSQGPPTSPTPPRPSPTPPAAPALTAAERARDRQAIVGVLYAYQRAFSNHSISGLAGIFATTIKRHGLAAGGCTVSYGRSAVLADYQSQFDEGSGTYELIGLTPGEIEMDGKTRAHIDAHYRIDRGTSGYVNFRFAELGEGWKVSEVNATCG